MIYLGKAILCACACAVIVGLLGACIAALGTDRDWEGE